MRSRLQRLILAFAAVAVAGQVFQFNCAGFAGEQFLRVVDFCFLFDCQNGALGGLINPCPNTTSSSTTTSVGGSTTGSSTTVDDGVRSDNLFVDCPPAEDEQG
jgi:hypothetical protein